MIAAIGSIRASTELPLEPLVNCGACVEVPELLVELVLRVVGVSIDDDDDDDDDDEILILRVVDDGVDKGENEYDEEEDEVDEVVVKP